MTREEATIQSLMGHIEALEDTIKRQSETIKALEQEPCEDCISRRAVLDMTICDGISCDKCSFNICENGKSGCLLNERISELPPVTPTRKTGHWIMLGGKEEIYCEEAKCSICGSVEVNAGYDKYCPNCGAKMESEDKE